MRGHVPYHGTVVDDGRGPDGVGPKHRRRVQADELGPTRQVGERCVAEGVLCSRRGAMLLKVDGDLDVLPAA